MADRVIFLVIGIDFGQSPTCMPQQFRIDYFFTDPTFTAWLFEEAAKGADNDVTATGSLSSKNETPAEAEPDLPRAAQPQSVKESARVSRSGVYQQALAQAIPSGSSAQKRAASARSPSPSHPNKLRKTDLPTGPRAMHRDGANSGGSNRSLLDRVGGPGRNGHQDEIQARIDSIVNNAEQNMMMPPGFPSMMEMNQMAAANMTNPILLQEMMMNQMALMAQMATSMGIINPATGQFAGQGFQGVVPPDMNIFPPPNMNNGFASQQGGANPPTNNGIRGRGAARGGRGTGRGRGGSAVGGSSGPSQTSTHATPAQITDVTQSSLTVVAPAPVAPTPVITTPVTPTPAYAVPERPLSPTLCKFGLKCTNAHCRYSHPSPIATAESGVVLSNDPCEKGKDCKDKDCIKAHVSPAVLNPNGNQIFLVQVLNWLSYKFSTQLSNRYLRRLSLPLMSSIHPSLVVLGLPVHDRVAHIPIRIAQHRAQSRVDLVPLARAPSVLSNILKDVSFRLLSIADCLRLVPWSTFPPPKPGVWAAQVLTRA